MTLLATRRGPVELRELRSAREMADAETIQSRVWGEGTIPHPKEMLIAAQYEGALAAGAFSAEGEMVGLVFSFPTRDPAAHHSQLLATLESWRGLGIGTQLKWFQRAWCLERGITTVRWTVDPLRAANAELNFRNLGGQASIYLPDYYGPMQGIDAGVPTDRLLIDWRLASPRVAARVDAPPADGGFPGAAPALDSSAGCPAAARLDLDSLRLLVKLPVDFVGLCRSDLPLALAWRAQARAVLQHYFARGYAVTGFTRAGGPACLLTLPEEP